MPTRRHMHERHLQLMSNIPRYPAPRQTYLFFTNWFFSGREIATSRPDVCLQTGGKCLTEIEISKTPFCRHALTETYPIYYSKITISAPDIEYFFFTPPATFRDTQAIP